MDDEPTVTDVLFELLDGSRRETSSGSMEQVDWTSSVEETVAAMRARGGGRGVAGERRPCSDRLAAPRANPEKLERVLFNLIQNAIRHTPADGGEIWFADSVRGARVRMRLPRV